LTGSKTNRRSRVTRPRQPAPWRDLGVTAALLTIVGVLTAGIVLSPPTAATNDPYTTVAARWTVDDVPQPAAFVGLGVFVYRPNWPGTLQTFDGPILLEVEDAQAPVRARFAGEVSIGRRGDGVLTTGAPPPTPAAGSTIETTLTTGDLVAIPAGIGFGIATDIGEAVRFQATALLPAGPPETPAIPQVEWRAWGEVDPAPGAPLTVTVADVFLAGDETYAFRQERGPALISIEGSGDGTQSIALTVTRGRAAYLRVAEVAPWHLSEPASYVATPTPTSLNRERAFDARSGAFLPTGDEARLRNRSLVDGTGVRLVTFDGPAVETPAAASTAPRPTQ
jgi:hypothetical protein